MAIGNNSEREKGSRALVTKKRSSFAVPQFEQLVDVSDEDDDEPTMVHTALLGHGLELPEAAHAGEPAEEWHFQISVGMQDLERLAELGLVSRETLAWRPGLPEWKRVEEIPQLELSLQAARSSLRPPRPRSSTSMPAARTITPRHRWPRRSR